MLHSVVWAVLLSSADPQCASADHPDASLERIRKALATPSIQSQSLPPEPTFRVRIQQTLLFDQSSQRDDLTGGPTPPGGLYAFEQRQRSGNPWAGQPWIQVDMLALAERLIKSVKDTRRAHDERTAHEEVLRALSALCVANVCDATER